MLFNSPAFLLLFLPATLLLFYVAGKTWGGRSSDAVLIAASCAFYALWDYVPAVAIEIMKQTYPAGPR